MIRVILIQIRKQRPLVLLLLVKVLMEFVVFPQVKLELVRMYVDGCINVSDRGRSCYGRDHVSDDVNDRDGGDGGDRPSANDRDDVHARSQAGSMQPFHQQSHSKTQESSPFPFPLPSPQVSTSSASPNQQ